MYWLDYFQGLGLSSDKAVEYTVKTYTSELIIYAAVLLAVIIVIAICLTLIFRRR